MNVSERKIYQQTNTNNYMDGSCRLHLNVQPAIEANTNAELR